MFGSWRTLGWATTAQLVVFAGSTWAAGGLAGEDWPFEVVMIAANTLPLLLLRWNPVVVVLILALAYPTWLLSGGEAHILQSLPSVTAMYAAGEWPAPLGVRAIAHLSPAFMLGSAVSGWWEGADPLEIGYIAIVFVAVWALGVLLQARRAHVEELEQKTAALERAERQLAERAVAEERARIARELHDVVAHAMSVITVQAGVGAHLIDSQPAQAADALRTIEVTGRDAMDEMRRMLTMLQEPDGGDPAYPQPGLGDVPRLVRQVEAAGVSVTLRQEGPAISVSPGLDLAAYRVIQEALTNAVKHSPGAKVDVAVRQDDERVELEVRSRGPVAADYRPGQGLGGMAERVALYGGEFDAGPRSDGFEVRAVLPLGSRL